MTWVLIGIQPKNDIGLIENDIGSLGMTWVLIGIQPKNEHWFN